MSTPSPDPDSPFASFAQPKPSALKQFVERREQAAQSSKAHWQYLGVAFAGTVIAAAAAAAIGMGPQFFLLALVFGAGGALAGVPAGWLLAAISWAVMRNRMMGTGGVLGMALASSPAQAELIRGNRWNKLLVWLTVWAAVGMVCGAAVGAMLATDSINQTAVETALGWSMSGACLGLAGATGAWFALRRRWTSGVGVTGESER